MEAGSTVDEGVRSLLTRSSPGRISERTSDSDSRQAADAVFEEASTMYKLMAGVIGAALVVATVITVFAATETIKGQIVDQACYLKDKANNVGKDHKMPADTKDCAVGCAKQGHPLALLTADGRS